MVFFIIELFEMIELFVFAASFQNTVPKNIFVDNYGDFDATQV